MHFSRGESSNLERGVGDVVGVTVSWGLRGTNGKEMVDTGDPQPHLVTGPAHQGPEVHLSLGGVAHHTLAGHHHHVRLLSQQLCSMCTFYLFMNSLEIIPICTEKSN